MAEVTAPRPLAEDDERSHFDCGRESLNAWCQRHAWHNHAAGLSRVSVICDNETKLIVGYVTLSAAQIEREFLAKRDRRWGFADVPFDPQRAMIVRMADLAKSGIVG